MTQTDPTERSRTAAFSGHRSYKMRGGDPADTASRLRETLVNLISEGYDTFLCGMAEGFDLMAAGEVLRLREEFPGVRLVAVVPFRGQAERFPMAVTAEYRRVLSLADCVEVLAENYDPRCYHRRNDYLLTNASCMVFFYNGSPGGTHYCWQQAARRGLRVVNLCPGAASPGTLF